MGVIARHGAQAFNTAHRFNLKISGFTAVNEKRNYLSPDKMQAPSHQIEHN